MHKKFLSFLLFFKFSFNTQILKFNFDIPNDVIEIRLDKNDVVKILKLSDRSNIILEFILKPVAIKRVSEFLQLKSMLQNIYFIL